MAVRSETINSLAQSINDANTKNDGGGYVTSLVTPRSESIQRSFDFNSSTASASFAHFLGEVDAANVSSSYGSRAMPESKFGKAARIGTEAGVPVVAGAIARKALENAAGPLSAIGVGAITGAVSAVKETRFVENSGKGAKEFLQRKVTGRDEKIRKGSFWAGVAKFFNYPEYVTVKKSFGVDERKAGIEALLSRSGLDINNRDFYNNVLNLFNAGRERDLQILLREMHTQSKLTGFSEYETDEKMIRNLDATHALIYAFVEKNKIAELEQTLKESRDEIERAVKSMKRNYTAVSAVSRAVKSLVFYELFESVAGFLEAQKNIVENNPSVVSLKNEIHNTQAQLNEIYNQPIGIGLPEIPLHENAGAARDLLPNTGDSYSEVLSSAAERAGFSSIEDYLNAAPERLMRLEGIQQIAEQVSQHPELKMAVKNIASNLGVSEKDLWQAIMTRAPYDLSTSTIEGFDSIFKYEDVKNWLERLQTDTKAVASLRQGIEANRSLASEWNNLLDKMLNNGVEIKNAVSVESLEKNSEGLLNNLEQTFLARKELNTNLVELQRRLIEERNRLYDLQITNAKTVLGILTRSGAAIIAMIDTLARGADGSVRFGDENALRVVIPTATGTPPAASPAGVGAGVAPTPAAGPTRNAPPPARGGSGANTANPPRATPANTGQPQQVNSTQTPVSINPHNGSAIVPPITNIVPEFKTPKTLEEKIDRVKQNIDDYEKILANARANGIANEIARAQSVLVDYRAELQMLENELNLQQQNNSTTPKQSGS